MVSKTIFILALSLMSLLGATNVQLDMEQGSSACVTESILSPTGGGFTDLVITRDSNSPELTLVSNQDCGIVMVRLVDLSSNNSVHVEFFNVPQGVVSIPTDNMEVAENYVLYVNGSHNCYDSHQITVY